MKASFIVAGTMLLTILWNPNIVTNVAPQLFGFWGSPLYAQMPDDAHRVVVKRYLQNLKDHSVDEPKYFQSPRAESAIQLGHIKDTVAVKPLIEVLTNDYFPDVRAAAAYALGEIGDKRALPYLKEALQDWSIDVRIWAAWSLIQLGEGRSEKVISALIPIAKGTDQAHWDLRGKRRKEDIDRGIIDSKWDQNRRDAWRCHAIKLLAAINTEKGWKIIENLTKDGGRHVAATAKALLKKRNNANP